MICRQFSFRRGSKYVWWWLDVKGVHLVGLTANQTRSKLVLCIGTLTSKFLMIIRSASRLVISECELRKKSQRTFWGTGKTGPKIGLFVLVPIFSSLP